MKPQESREDIAAQIKDQADIVKIIGECVDLKKAVPGSSASVLFMERKLHRLRCIRGSSSSTVSVAANPAMSSPS